MPGREIAQEQTAMQRRGTLHHEALFYTGDAEYLEGTGTFIQQGLAAAEPVLIAVPDPGLALLRRAFGVAIGVRFLDMGRAGRNPGRIIPAVLHAFVTEHEGARVRIIGEPIWPGRSAAAYPRCVQHEALINIALADQPASILCPYDAAGLTADALADAASTHPLIICHGDRRSSSRYGPPEAMVDALNLPLSEPPTTPTTLIFDATGLSRVRRLVVQLSTAAGLAADRVSDLEIAANELAANAVTYGTTPAVLRMWVEPDGVLCEVTGASVLTDRLAGRVPAPPTSERGRGLLLVNHLCDLVQVHTDARSTTVRLYMAW